MDKIAKGYVKAEIFISNALMISIVLFVFIASVLRWAGFPIAGTEEIANLLFVWAIFIGANRALREDNHIGVDFFTKRLSDKPRVFIEIMILLIMLMFLVFLCIYGFQLSFENSVRTIRSLSISYSFVTGAVPVGSALMIITVLLKLRSKFMLLIDNSKNIDNNSKNF